MASLSCFIRYFSCLLLLNVIMSIQAAGQHPGDSGCYSTEQEYLFTVFQNRRSVRQFTFTPIPREHILTMLDIARSAPTAGNQQPWKFLVIQNQEKIQKLKEKQIAAVIKNLGNPEKGDSARNRLNAIYSGYLSAPLFIVVLTDNESKYPAYNIMDGTLAAGYLIIAARSLGYGTVFTTDSFSKDVIREVFSIPENLSLICFIPVGIPEKWPVPPNKKPLSDLLVFEQFESGPNIQKGLPTGNVTSIKNAWESYTGKYAYNGELIIEIFLKNDRLYMTSGESDPVELFCSEGNEFLLKDGKTRIVFLTDPEDQVTGFTVEHEGITYTTNKTE